MKDDLDKIFADMFGLKKDDSGSLPSMLKDCERFEIRLGTKFKMGMTVQAKDKWETDDIVGLLETAIQMMKNRVEHDAEIF